MAERPAMSLILDCETWLMDLIERVELGHITWFMPVEAEILWSSSGPNKRMGLKPATFRHNDGERLDM